MSARKTRVAINGYGVIGKRVADAVVRQDDMVVAGVSDVVTDYRIAIAVSRGYPLFAATAEAQEAMSSAGLPVDGRLVDLLDRADVVVDCTPKKVASQNRDLYREKRVKSVFQGGEKHEVAGYSSSQRRTTRERSGATCSGSCRAIPRRSVVSSRVFTPADSSRS